MNWLNSLERWSFRVDSALSSRHGWLISIGTGGRMHSLCWLKWYIPQILIHAFLWLSGILCWCRKLLGCLLAVWRWRQFICWRPDDLKLSKSSWLAYWCTNAFSVVTFLIIDAIFVLVKNSCVRYFILAFFTPTITWSPTILVGYVSNACTLRACAFVYS